ncbi:MULTISPECIES: histidine phosphatase family protein [unclassified Isoptericola]|uniref:histidine phosphatase family protein n=1 Tax=unclassified Isoptericola TaxID=2623355 RepID=UPI0027140695|nr:MULTISPECIES: histidine phosphatase family protein [unclassified Isoptericola]MDO8143257.1 histidine phosphatase family protein [Isoptericola sp. 178]MDO8147118.1 histidine phosphatase family protein [Isoptericola sp. b515]
MATTTVHLMRHGEVHNPEGVLYGRIPGYRLSDRGQQMARRVADHLTDTGRDVAAVVASPLQRAQETAAPVAAAFGLELATDDRLIEAGNLLEGSTIGTNPAQLAHPRYWKLLWNPLRPSWGEAYADQVVRMRAAVDDARRAHAGREVVLVSHQLPVWLTRLAFEGRRLAHDPRRRQCALASLTSLTFTDDHFAGLHYAEPAGDLLVGAEPQAGA